MTPEAPTPTGGLPRQSWYTEEVVERAAQSLRDEGGDPGHSIHGGRCEYPDHFGECDCVVATVKEILDAIAPMVEERLTMAHHDGYADGWNERGEDR